MKSSREKSYYRARDGSQSRNHQSYHHQRDGREYRGHREAYEHSWRADYTPTNHNSRPFPEETPHYSSPRKRHSPPGPYHEDVKRRRLTPAAFSPLPAAECTPEGGGRWGHSSRTDSGVHSFAGSEVRHWEGDGGRGGWREGGRRGQDEGSRGGWREGGRRGQDEGSRGGWREGGRRGQDEGGWTEGGRRERYEGSRGGWREGGRRGQDEGSRGGWREGGRRGQDEGSRGGWTEGGRRRQDEGSRGGWREGGRRGQDEGSRGGWEEGEKRGEDRGRWREGEKRGQDEGSRSSWTEGGRDDCGARKGECRNEDFWTAHTKSSLPATYYTTRSNGEVEGTDALKKLHLDFTALLQSFTRAVPQRYSLLSSTSVRDDESPCTVAQGGSQAGHCGAPCNQPEAETSSESPCKQSEPKVGDCESPCKQSEPKVGDCESPCKQSEPGSSKVGDCESPVRPQQGNTQEGGGEEVRSKAVEEVSGEIMSEVREEDSVHEHVPINRPTQKVFSPCKEKYHKFGKCCEVNIDASPPELWHCYRIDVTPTTNLKFPAGRSKVVTATGLEYVFQGFSVLSRHSLDTLPDCVFDRYGGRYVVKLVKDPLIKNFVLRDALMFEEYLFVKLMEILDWTEYLAPFASELLFIPRFCGKINGDEGCELLSMAELLSHLLTSHLPLREQDLSGQRRDGNMEGVLVCHHQKAPSCLRIDEVVHDAKIEGVMLNHYCSQLQRSARNLPDDKDKKSHKKLKALLSKKEQGKKLTRKEHFQLNDLKHKAGIELSDAAKLFCTDHLAEFSWQGYFRTGLCCDISQHVLLLPVLSHHILLHDSLHTLQQRLGYHFTNFSLLHRALTHPSSTTTSLLVADTHLRNALSNCGLRSTESLPPTGSRGSKGMKDLIKFAEMALEEVDESLRLLHNEQLEFLGDAVLEYICSKHLFLNHPDYGVGKLTHGRQPLVKNKHLIGLAERIGLGDFMLRNPKAMLGEHRSTHVLSNCLEALLGAVFLDGGLREADELFARLAFPEEEKYREWMTTPAHPLMSKFPDGDRHLIEESDLIKSTAALEERIGIKFKHLSLLAKAFVHSSSSDTSVTGGSYQRLEFLGDAILQFIVSKFVYGKFPAHNEGHLSLLRTKLVENKQLADICQTLGFDKFFVTSKTEKVELSTKIMADLVESFLAALYLDQGLDKAEKFLEQHLFPKLKEAVSKSQLVDATTRLNQAAAYTCKQRGVGIELPVLRLVKKEGPVDKPIFIIGVFMGKRQLAVGSGPSKREARSNASEAALKTGILRIPPPKK